jgi:hypothetical protein
MLCAAQSTITGGISHSSEVDSMAPVRYNIGSSVGKLHGALGKVVVSSGWAGGYWNRLATVAGFGRRWWAAELPVLEHSSMDKAQDWFTDM